MTEGLTIAGGVRLKWHRLRRRAQDPEFSPARLAEGLALGASMEVDLQARADGGFAVLHDADLSGETDGTGPVAGIDRAGLAGLRLRACDRAPMGSEDLAGLLTAAHPGALLQLDMKDHALGPAHIAHLVQHFGPHAGRLIASGASEALIAALAHSMPGLKVGYDPTDDLVALDPLARVARLIACLTHPVRPAMVYLNWHLLLDTAAQGLDLVALAHDHGVQVDAWTHRMADPEAGFTDAEWAQFQDLLALRPDQITTDSPLATERAFRLRRSGS